jgi:hypothetical protein
MFYLQVTNSVSKIFLFASKVVGVLPFAISSGGGALPIIETAITHSVPLRDRSQPKLAQYSSS